MKFLAIRLSLCILGSCAALGADIAKPNIVVIVTDDLGNADVAFHPQHSKDITTPSLAALANEGVICRQDYVSGHVCLPTRAGLMTGRYQQRQEERNLGGQFDQATGSLSAKDNTSAFLT